MSKICSSNPDIFSISLHFVTASERLYFQCITVNIKIRDFLKENILMKRLNKQPSLKLRVQIS